MTVDLDTVRPDGRIISSDYDFDTTLERLLLKSGRYLQTCVDVNIRHHRATNAVFSFQVSDVRTAGAISLKDNAEVIIQTLDFKHYYSIRIAIVVNLGWYLFVSSILLGAPRSDGETVLGVLFLVIFLCFGFTLVSLINYFSSWRRYQRVLNLIEDAVTRSPAKPKRKRADI